jgi:hypothetical protein
VTEFILHLYALPESEQLFNPLLSQDVLRTFGGAVQGEVLNLVKCDAVRDRRVGQYANLELASRAGR